MAALVLLADAVGLLQWAGAILDARASGPMWWTAALAEGDPTLLWNIRAAAVGLAGGAWVAFGLARRVRKTAMPAPVMSGILVVIAGATVLLDWLAFDPVRDVVAAGDWVWLRLALAKPGMSWFWYSLALTLAGGGLFFVLPPPQAHEGPALKAAVEIDLGDRKSVV